MKSFGERWCTLLTLSMVGMWLHVGYQWHAAGPSADHAMFAVYFWLIVPNLAGIVATFGAIGWTLCMWIKDTPAPEPPNE